ncbi:hypothetical protein CEXT_433061 [Caerostris extrusa]|uniref:Uncharacterized protein n=1 Tax=Caerostris extrusa TaxID=172846 RepID=A0AAV4SCZ9_CAEEX|nr:hypothetical protein CEXT_433061 [Caerostris extrusa]
MGGGCKTWMRRTKKGSAQNFGFNLVLVSSRLLRGCENKEVRIKMEQYCGVALGGNRMIGPLLMCSIERRGEGIKRGGCDVCGGGEISK